MLPTYRKQNKNTRFVEPAVGFDPELVSEESLVDLVRSNHACWIHRINRLAEWPPVYDPSQR